MHLEYFSFLLKMTTNKQKTSSPNYILVPNPTRRKVVPKEKWGPMPTTFNVGGICGIYVNQTRLILDPDRVDDEFLHVRPDYFGEQMAQG